MGKMRSVSGYSGFVWAILPAFPFIVMFVASFVGHGSTPVVSQRAESGLGWDIADGMIENRARYRLASGHDGFPEWSECTREYFRSLTDRRASVIAWAASRPVPPAIVFVGNLHARPGGDTTPAEMLEIEQIQPTVFNRLRVHGEDAAVIAIEEAGTEGAITPEGYVELIQRLLVSRRGLSPPIDEVRRIVSQDRHPEVRAILELSTPVIYGEEWPLQLEKRMRMRAWPADEEARNTLSEYLGRSVRLRTEIILIRTLEYLRRVGGSKGVIIQGDDHRQMAEVLAPTYHISFLGIPVD